MTEKSSHKVKCFGYNSLSNTEILNKFKKDGADSLRYLHGDYIIILENEDETFFISSPYAVCQYYYTTQNGKLYHSDMVLQVFRDSKLEWKWNWQGLADFLYFEHVMENETLHPEIHRVPQASVLHFQKGKLTVNSTSWAELHPSGHGNPKRALDIFNQSVGQWCSNQPILSISGGFDTRLILSSMLKQGIKPSLLVMGSEECFDVKIARQIAKKFSLELEVIHLEPNDYLKYGQETVRLANGTIQAYNWHSYIYLAKSGMDSARPMFLGANGEFARSFCSDAGILSLMTYFQPEIALRFLWQRFMNTKTFTEQEIVNFSPAFTQELSNNLHETYLKRMRDLCLNKLYPGIDIFYLSQRVRNFISNGVKVCQNRFEGRMPLICHDWCKEIWNLNRCWKLGSNWHRYAIAQNCPELLDFEEEKTGRKMTARAQQLYWLRNRGKSVVRYTDCPKWFQRDEFASLIFDNAGILSELTGKQDIKKIITEHQQTGNRVHAISFLLTMVHWLKLLRE